jgi:serine protease Do
VVEQLREKGEVSRGGIGVAIQPVNEDLASGLGLETPRGGLVADVTAGAPADSAGLEIGDVLLEFAGESISERVRLPRLVADTEIGSNVPVKLWRDGSEMTLELTVGDLGAAPSGEPDERPSEPESTDAEGGLGLRLSPIEPEMRDQLGLEAGAAGVLVAGVEPDSVAAERGLRIGDVIMRVGREEVARPEDVVKTVQAAQQRGDKTILMLIERQGASRFVALPVSAG